MKKPSSKFDQQMHTNWGYWNGVADAARGKWPVWAKPGVARTAHPFDRQYGEGYWIGRYGAPAPKGSVI